MSKETYHVVKTVKKFDSWSEAVKYAESIQNPKKKEIAIIEVTEHDLEFAPDDERLMLML